ncbi:MAG: hypothetical protein VW683_01460 [Betaproteobacteria bacterium]|jgi:hypothetical protein
MAYRTKDFILTQFPKTASRSLNYFIDLFYNPMEQISEDHYGLHGIDTGNLPIIVGVRNPWEWYLSYYFMYVAGLTIGLDYITDYKKDTVVSFKQWLTELYSDKPKYRLTNVIESPWGTDPPAWKTELTGILSLTYPRFLNLDDPFNDDRVIWIRTENHEMDLFKCLNRFVGYNHDLLQIFTRQPPRHIINRNKLGVNIKDVAESFYDEDLWALVMEKEKVIIDKFQYKLERP